MPSPFRISVLAGLASAALVSLASTGPALADRIRNPTAVFAGLDKITGRIISFEVAIDETVQFGALQIDAARLLDAAADRGAADDEPSPRSTRSPSTTSIAASSPAGCMRRARACTASSIAIYDVWLTDCKGGTELVVDPKEPEAPPPPEEPRRPRTAPAARRHPARARAAASASTSQPPRGVPVQPRQAPNQRFFPTNPVPGRDPTGSN